MEKAERASSIPATKSSAFIALVLGPIPETEEQADTAKFRKQVTADINRVWQAGKDRLKRTRLFLDAERAKSGESRVTLALVREFHKEALRQCLIPAPSEKELRWKKREVEWRNDLPEAVKEAIARDEKRFGGGAA